MKTLTEFSALVLRKAAEARASAASARAAKAGDVAEAPALDAAAAAEAEAPPAEAEPAPAEAAPAEAEAAPAPAEGEAPAEPPPPQQPPDPVIDAVAAALSVQPDRAARMLEALDIVGDDLDRVRLVRVYQGETGPHGSVSRGEFHYSIDRVAGQQRRGRDRDDRRGGGGRGERGGGRDRGGFGGDRGPPKPRGLGSLKIGAAKDEPRDDRPGRGEMPRAGIGWQLQSAPREARDDRGGPRRGGPKRGRGRTEDRRDDRGPRGPRGPRDNRGGFDRDARDRGGPPRTAPNDAVPRETMAPSDTLRNVAPPPPAPADAAQQQPRKPRRPRKPIGPDANGLGPDGQPWDPERRAKKLAEREAAKAANAQAPTEAVNAAPAPSVEAPAASPDHVADRTE